MTTVTSVAVKLYLFEDYNTVKVLFCPLLGTFEALKVPRLPSRPPDKIKKSMEECGTMVE